MSIGPACAPPFAVSVETSDLDEARQVCGEHLYPRTLRLLHPTARLSARFAFLRLGEVTVADIRYGADIAGDCGELGSYHVNLPLAGTFSATHDGRLITGDPAHAGVYRPVGTNVLHRSSADCRFLALKIDTIVLERTMQALLDAPVRGPLKLGGRLDLRETYGRGYAKLIRLVGREIDNPTGLIYQPIFVAPFQEGLLTALLYATTHQYEEALHRAPPRGAQRNVARAIDAIHAEPQRPYTIAALAEIADVSPRCLCRGFRDHVGMPPLAYLRKIRIGRAHADLVAADPAETSVADIARRWGFARTGRFAAHYRARYGAHPAETLHHRRRP